MNLKFNGPIIMMAILIALTAPLELAAQQHHRYKLIILGSLGGPNSVTGSTEMSSRPLNNRGTILVVGDTTVPDPFNPGFNIFHFYTWSNGIQTDFNVLPVQRGSAGNDAYPNWISDSGVVAGWSANGLVDPITQAPETHATLWTPEGRIVDLGTLGGYQSHANAVNNFGLVAGWVENTIPDLFSFGEGTQTQGFLWAFGVMHPLGTLGGPDSSAFTINDLGQASGCSLTNDTPNATTGVPTYDAFIWTNGKMIDLHPGNFGGTVGCANYLNNRSQVVGFMNLAGDQNMHPFFWDRGETTDLFTVGSLQGNYGSAYVVNDQGHVTGFASLPGDAAIHSVLWRSGEITDIQTVDGDPCSLSHDINSSDQIVGTSGSCDFSTVLHAFLWENGEIVDLNALIPANSGIQLQSAYEINDSGVIAGNGVLTAYGDSRVFLLIPQDNDLEANMADTVSVPRPKLPATFRVSDTPGAIGPWAMAHAASHRIIKPHLPSTN